jgi:hypothetical protein
VKLQDLGSGSIDKWFQQLLSFSRKGISFDDNIDAQFWTGNIGTAETEIGHSLGRTPRYVIEVASYPNGTAGIQFTKAPDDKRLFLKRSSAGQCTLMIF